MATVRATLALTLALVFCGSAVGQTVVPPVAKRVDHSEERHGELVVDEYHWLREKSNPEVLEYLEAENAYAETVTHEIKPLVETIYREMISRIKQTDLSVPTRRGAYYYYTRIAEGQQYPVHCRRQGSMDAAEEVVLDLNELAEGQEFLSLGDFTISDDDNLLAYTTDTSGFRQCTLHVKDLRTGKTLSDTHPRVTSVHWAADNETLFLTTEDPLTKRSNQVWRHRLGSAEFEPFYEETDELFKVHVSRTRDKKFVMLQITSHEASEVRCLAANQPRGEFRILLPRADRHRYRVDHREGLFYILTNQDAKNYKIVTAPDNDPRPENWQEFVAQRDDVLVQGIQLYKNFAVVVEKSNALNTIRTFDFRNETWHSMTFPEPVYTAFPMGGPEYEQTTYRYSYQSLVTPSSVYDYDMETHTATLLKQQEVQGGYDATQYVSERLWVTARDGVRVPLSIVYKKGYRRDGRGPLFMYAYGSYGTGVSPLFSSERLSLLDRGMAFVIAHVRGGNELGETWREDGARMKKKNTFFDFIDAAEYLIKEKWTSSEKLAIQGYSAGGLLVGAVANMRPDLFGAVHAGVPFVDVMNTMFDPSLPLTVGEYLVWGNPNDKEAYDYMLSYSPYDNLAERDYPAMLVTASFNDSQVMYWEPAKYVARLRTLKTDNNPLVLKTNMSAGHSGASGRYDRLREEAFEYAWLMSQVGITK